ncbi:MAG: hypothetical protein V7785_19800 [Bermanella sp.]
MTNIKNMKSIINQPWAYLFFSLGLFFILVNSTQAKTLPTVKYAVAGYEIQMEFLEDNQLRWTYLDAPTPPEVGMSAIENADITKLRRGLYLMTWSEASGAKVVDIFDFKKNKIYANFVSSSGERFKSEASLSLVE